MMFSSTLIDALGKKKIIKDRRDEFLLFRGEKLLLKWMNC